MVFIMLLDKTVQFRDADVKVIYVEKDIENDEIRTESL